MSGNRMSRQKILSRGLVRKRGEMNKSEAAYAADLEICLREGKIAGYWFEPFSLRLTHPEAGQPARYSPDFMVLLNDGTTMIDDVKTSSGFDDLAAIVRIKCAAELFPLWKFRLVRRVKGDWEFKTV